jgi:ribose-phosphate pyrophosphokinase
MNLDNVVTKKFPGGELHPIMDGEKFDSEIFAPIRNSDDLMKLFLLTDAYNRINKFSPDLYLPYIPYARQDRVANAGEALSIKVLAKLINSQAYNSVRVLDPHSDVSSALIDNIDIYHVDDSFLRKVINGYDNKIVIAPDAGSYKKLSKLIKDVPVIQCTKERNTLTGELGNLKVHTDMDLNGKELLVVDDICDGGYTFILLGEELKKICKPDKLELYVSHGIFSKGMDVLKKYYDHVYTTDSFTRLSQADEYLTIFSLYEESQKQRNMFSACNFVENLGE